MLAVDLPNVPTRLMIAILFATMEKCKQKPYLILSELGGLYNLLFFSFESMIQIQLGKLIIRDTSRIKTESRVQCARTIVTMDYATAREPTAQMAAPWTCVLARALVHMPLLQADIARTVSVLSLSI